MELGEFNNDYLPNLLEKLLMKDLFGDFNANLLKYDIDTDISIFLDLIYSFFLLAHIASPTLIDNIFTNICNYPYTSGNLVITLSDHHAQFIIIENQPNLSESKKESPLYRDFQEIATGKCGLGMWLCLERNNINLSSELLTNKVDRLMNFWASLQKILRKRKKTLNKPWMTKGIIISIKIKNTLHKKLCHLKDPSKTRELEINPICHGIFFTLVVMVGGQIPPPPTPPPPASVLLIDKWCRSFAFANKSSTFYEQNLIVRYLLTSLFFW